jgi:hypothetical protein
MPQYRMKRGGMHEKYHASRNKIQMIGGGFGNGKTAAGCVKALSLVKAYPGCNGLIAMATYAQLNDTIREEIYKWVPHKSVKRWPTVSDNTLIFNNGSKINFRYIQQKGKASAADGQTSSNLLSATYDWILIDQIENPAIRYKDFLDMLGRLRGTTEYRGHDPSMPKSGPRWLMLLANPSFNWVYHKLIRPMKMYEENGTIHPDLIVGEDGKPLIDLFEASTYENAHNLPEDFIKGLEAAYTGQFRDRYLGGQYGAFEGLVYPDFEQNFHMIPHLDIMKYLLRIGQQGERPIAIEGYDHGIANPACYMIGFVDSAGRIFILDGFYQTNMSVTELVEAKENLRRKYSSMLTITDSILADPAIFRRTAVEGQGGKATTIRRLLEDQSFTLSYRPAQNAIMPGITKVSSYLAVKDFPHFETGERNGGLLYVSKDLPWFGDEMLGYFWKRKSTGELEDTPNDNNDHAMDTLKYMLSYVPQAVELWSNKDLFIRGQNAWQMALRSA